MITNVRESRLLVTSDTHIGNLFCDARPGLIRLLDYARANAYNVCINGDGIDVLQTSVQRMIAETPALLRDFRRIASDITIYYTIGNHDIILEHYEYPRNKGLLADADATSRGENATCGDDLQVSVRLSGEKCPEVGWDGHACAIGEASASMMAETVEGQETDGTRSWIRTVRGMLTGKAGEMDTSLELGDLESLGGVRQYPVRIKCVLLAWEALDETARRLAAREQADGPAIMIQPSIEESRS